MEAKEKVMFDGKAADWDLSGPIDEDTRQAVVAEMNLICDESFLMADNDLRDASDLVDGESKIDRLSCVATDIYLEITSRFSSSDQILFANGDNPRALNYIKSRIRRLIADRFEINEEEITIGVSNGRH